MQAATLLDSLHFCRSLVLDNKILEKVKILQQIFSLPKIEVHKTEARYAT